MRCYKPWPELPRTPLWRSSQNSYSTNSGSRLRLRLVIDNLTGCDLGWVREQGRFMLLHELSCPKGRLLLSVLMLKDADCNHYAVPGVDQVVSHESRHFANDGHKALLAQLGYLLRVSHALVSAHCNVHSFSLPPLKRGRDSSAPACCTTAASMTGCKSWRIPQSAYSWSYFVVASCGELRRMPIL